MIVEGPVVTIIAAMLSRLGAFNVGIVFMLSVLGDMIGDVILYGLGRRFGLGFVRHAGKYVGITESLVQRMERYFVRHGGATIFTVKSTTGLCWATFVAAGIVKMDFRKFVRYSFLGGLVWSGFLVGMGYFYGYLWKTIRVYISWVGWVIFGLAIISFGIITLYKRRKGREVLNESLENNNGTVA